jgi:hypothetical protein
MAYDIIADTHGHASKLKALLIELGYRPNKWGTFVHPDPQRKALFVGDFTDRGPEQLETINTVRRMMDAGGALAVMGNHELNAISYHTPDWNRPGQYLRPRHGEKGAHNRLQHLAFLNEVEHLPHLHAEIIGWFKTLPLWLDLPEVRVVHACWDPKTQEALAPILKSDHSIKPECFTAVCTHGTPEFERVEMITKGPEIQLPAEFEFRDSEGIARSTSRIRWWDETATTYRDLAIMPDGDERHLPLITVPRDQHPAYDHAKPLFFGHYWFTGNPEPLNRSVACVDYSVAKKDGPMVAYRWDGEPELIRDNFLSVGGQALILRP